MREVPGKTEEFMLGVPVLPRHSAVDLTLDKMNYMNQLLN